ncbi:multiple epidermal growth factor-like domains protein 10 isoform X6 [Dreissena polymorpha]|uniref:multiple epidermal growth factor-like domains protein 10 isoform X6 n=1 Tax=Dreissena polymorpha TaxID=45954 RepID=UPI0022649356|nr:multiple epidermal growth factor-like domains protein 10 isoform X6 [Dreissena polymorpha]
MDYKPRPLCCRLHVLFAGIILVLSFSHINATTTSVVLYNSINVAVGQQATYNCSISGTGPDPSVAWKMTDTSGNPISVSFTVRNTGTDITSDGSLLSSNTFLVQSSHINQRLWCSVTDVGSASTSYQIFTHITETSATTANLGETCSPNVQCTPTNSECRNSVCVCRTGYRVNGNTCNLIGIGDSCAGSTCLPANSFCNQQSVCACNTGFYESSGSCLQKKNLGDTCTAGNNAMCGPDFSACSSLPPYTCVCQSGYTRSGSSCVLSSVGLGEVCVNPTRTCYTSNAHCEGTVCVCDAGYSVSGLAGNACALSPANIGEPCTNPSRSCVTSNTVCAGTCVCASGFIQSGNACFLSTVTIGQSCTNPSRTCTTSNTVCGGSGTCVCANGFVQSGSTCITSNAALGDQCANPSRSCVTANAICGAQGFCVCGTGFVQSGSSCISSSANIGESCVNPPRSCVTGNTVCDTQQGACTCASGFVQSGSTCVSSSVGLGGQCVNPARTCTIANSVCGPQGTCECASGFTSSGSSCVISTAGLGDNCTTPARACGTTNSECNSTSGQCECNPGFISNGTNCFSTGATLGQACINPTRTCSVQYSVCREGTCQCDVGYILNGNVCQMPTIGQACAVNVGCQVTATGGTTTNPQCITGRCACPTGYYTYNNVCFEKSTTGATCDARVANSCLDDQASCTGTPATCTCNFGYTFVSGYCIIVNASDCPVNTQIPSTQPGAINAPDVYVGATCYQVDLGASNTMRCMDTKYQAALQSANWFKMPGYTAVVKSTGGFINGDISNTNMTVSNAQNVYGGNYICTLCYGSGFTRCTNSSQVQLLVKGAAIQSTSLTANPSVNVVRGGSFTFTCGTSPAGVATSFTFYKGSDVVQSGPSSTYFISSVQAVHDGSYTCLATNTNSQRTSDIYVIAAQYKPEYFLSGGGDTQTVFHDFANGDVQITCASMSANPPVSLYSFFNSSGSLLFSGLTPTYTVTGEQGYQRYSCTAANALGVSSAQFIEVTEPETNPGTGAATQDDGIGTGTIVAIVLGIIFLLLLIIIIIVCCCSYGWCRKKEKVQPEVIVEPPRVKPYIPRTIASATPSVRTAKDVGVMVHGVPVTEEFEPVYSATPRYHLKPAVNGGPIISLMDDSFEKPQPRPLQLPPLDTQYLYTDGDQKRRHRKKRRKHSRRRHHEDRGPSEEDLVVVVDRHQYENGYE